MFRGALVFEGAYDSSGKSLAVLVTSGISWVADGQGCEGGAGGRGLDPEQVACAGVLVDAREDGGGLWRSSARVVPGEAHDDVALFLSLSYTHLCFEETGSNRVYPEMSAYGSVRLVGRSVGKGDECLSVWF